MHFSEELLSEEQYQMLINVCHEALPWPSSPFYSPSVSEPFRSPRQNKYLATEGSSSLNWRSAHIWYLIQWSTLLPLALLIIFHCQHQELLYPSTSCLCSRKIKKLRCTQSTRSRNINYFTK